MKSLLLSNEYPPHVYGGAGIHVEYLSREMAKFCDVEVRCFGEQDSPATNPAALGFATETSGYTCPPPLKSVFGALDKCLQFNTTNIDADVVHVHTWYAHFGGILASLNYGIPLALTVHSLEPLRPWKREQLGGGYDFTLWLEKTAIEMADAVIAVSKETKADILNLFDVDESKVPIIYNGIDPDEYVPTRDDDVLRKFEIDPEKPFVLFVGRITRQKGIIHLVNAIKHIDPNCQVVLCAGAPDTPEIGAEMRDAVEVARGSFGGNIVWIDEMVSNYQKIVLYSHASVFCCPSIYEPFGIINLEAMACETPIVASKVGGMKEIIIDGETGLHVPLDQHKESPFEAKSPEKFAADLAEAINSLLKNPSLCEKMGKAGRQRVQEHFSWTAIARETVDLYQKIAKKG
ncbi:MAG: glycogen synthase [Verrucomicrobiales bacterium]|nr:glycogen synthase [Verrucomicrobiales bacterium]